MIVPRLWCRNGHGIEAALREWMAAGKTSERKPRASNRAEAMQRDISVLRARGQIQALRRRDGVREWREYPLVEEEEYPEGDGFGL